jgi:hypothetical protein
MVEVVQIRNSGPACDVGITSQPYGPGDKDKGPNPARQVQRVKIPAGTRKDPGLATVTFTYNAVFPFWYVDVYSTAGELPPAYPPGVGPAPEPTENQKRNPARQLYGGIDPYDKADAPSEPRRQRVRQFYPLPYPQASNVFGSSGTFVLRVTGTRLPPGWSLVSITPSPGEPFSLTRLGNNSRDIAAEFDIPANAEVGSMGEVAYEVTQQGRLLRWRGRLGVVIQGSSSG